MLMTYNSVCLAYLCLILSNFETKVSGCCRTGLPEIPSWNKRTSSLPTGFKTYQLEGLKMHNSYRGKHVDVPKMELNAELTKMADKCAEYYRDRVIDHTCPYKKNVGENLYWTSEIDEDGVKSVKNGITAWYNEIQNWDFKKGRGKGSGVTGHFTQVVWKESTQLGIGMYSNSKGTRKGTTVVGLYRKPGNSGQYKKNVAPLK